MKNQILLSMIVASCALWLGSCGGGQSSAAPNPDLAAFNAGIAQYDVKDYATAAGTFSSFITTYPNSSLISTSHYYLGKSLYYLNDFTGAIAQFDIVLRAYPTSSFADNSLFWKGKSLQNQAGIQFIAGNLAVAAALFADARAAYQNMFVAYPNSTLVPDCHYHIGTTYYDEQRYVDSIPIFQAVLASYPTSSAADGAQYYLARAIHGLALAAAPGYTFLQARAEYAKLMTNYPASVWADNAQFQIGKTYYDEANYATAIVEFNKVFNYATPSSGDDAQYYIGRAYHKQLNFIAARTAYGLVVTNYPTSIFVDNASYHSALTYHDSTQCTLELAAMQAFVAAYPMSTFVATANTHISDLTLIPRVTHTLCVP